MTKINKAIERIRELVQKGDPAVVWVYASAGKKRGFGSHYHKTRGPILPKKQRTLDLGKEGATILMKKLAVVSKHSIVFDEARPAYSESQWWSPTNIPGAVLHHAEWEQECWGAESTFIIVGLPDGVCEDLQAVLENIQKILEGFSCEDISDLSRDEMDDIHSKSSGNLDYAEALWEKAQELNAQGDLLKQLKTTINRKKLEYLIAQELPWRNTPELISDIKVYTEKIQEICAELQIDLPDKVRPYISDYGNYVVSLYEKDLKESSDPLWYYYYNNLEEYKIKTTALVSRLYELENFIDLAGDKELSQRFLVVEDKLLQRWSEESKKYNSIWGDLKCRINNMLWFLR